MLIMFGINLVKIKLVVMYKLNFIVADMPWWQCGEPVTDDRG